jgi:hypothetical protein
MFRKKGLLSTKLLALGIIFALGSACAQNSKEKAENAYKEFEQVITGRNAEECRRVKERCLAAIDKAIREGKTHLRALQARIASGANRDHLRDITIGNEIRDLEEDLAALRLKEEKVKSVDCDRLNLTDVEPPAPSGASN